jgi:DNA-binding transcriptional regulator YhcF (GntR family)
MVGQNSAPIYHHMFAAVKQNIIDDKLQDDHRVESISTQQKTTQETRC